MTINKLDQRILNKRASQHSRGTSDADGRDRRQQQVRLDCFTQWTLGKSGNGTLAEFMRDLKKTNPTQFQASPGKYGLDIDSKSVVLTRGDGSVLKGVDAAGAIRKATLK